MGGCLSCCLGQSDSDGVELVEFRSVQEEHISSQQDNEHQHTVSVSVEKEPDEMLQKSPAEPAPQPDPSTVRQIEEVSVSVGKEPDEMLQKSPAEPAPQPDPSTVRQIEEVSVSVEKEPVEMLQKSPAEPAPQPDPSTVRQIEESGMMGGPLRPEEEMAYLTDRIDDLHFRYLSAQESLEKLDNKRRLEGYIRHYLMIAPHEKKFIFPETANILHVSAKARDGFSGLRASIAWAGLATFAHNLLTQSWRKEFTKIETYGGYYQHNVMEGLIGSELMLTLMGYRASGKGVFILDGSLDLDKVSHVSRDSLVAVVESQILCSLHGKLLRRGCNYSWLEILLYRESHPCSVEEALEALLCQYTSRRLPPASCRFDSYLEPTLCKSSSHSPPSPHLPSYNQPHPSSFNRCSNPHYHHPAPSVGSAVKLNDTKWECPFCTYHNRGEKEVCEMCCKSRVSGKESKPLSAEGNSAPSVRSSTRKVLQSARPAAPISKTLPALFVLDL